jgi:PPM family protein phosphatase
VAGRASIIGAAETNVGKVRDHNEDAHFFDPDLGIFVVCDGMGGHAAGEVASALAVKTIRERWSSDGLQSIADRWLAQGTPEARRKLLQAVTDGVIAAHDAILGEARIDKTKGGMGTTLVGAIVVGGDVVFAQSGDSRAYLVRDGIAMQLTEDHTLLARLLAAGIDVDVEGDGLRFKSMLTNALGIGHECKVTTFIVPVADGDRFLLCSDGVTEYVEEAEIGEVLTKMPSPARSAQRLVELALERGGSDNATALVVRVLEAGETARPPELLRREELAINACPLWARVNPQQRLRALRIALPREYAEGERLPAVTLGDQVAWIVVEGELEQDGLLRGPGALLYPEALLGDRPVPDKAGLAVAQSEVRALALRADDFRELCEDDPELAERLLEAIAAELAVRRPLRRTGKILIPETESSTRAPTTPASPLRQQHGVPADEHGPAVSEEDDELSVTDAVPVVVDEDSGRARGGASSGKRNPRGSTPPSESGLIVPPAELAATSDAVDRALSEIGLDTGWAELPDDEPPAQPPAPLPHERTEESEPEILVVAGGDSGATEVPADKRAKRHTDVPD